MTFRAPSPQTYWVERHADWFAAALLMPATLFVPTAERYDLSTPRGVSRLANRFGASLAATSTRLTQLGFSFCPPLPNFAAKPEDRIRTAES